MIAAIEDLFHQAIAFITQFIIPDWGELVNLMPVFLTFGLVGPLLTIAFLVWLVYLARRPRASIAIVEGPRAAPLDADGRPVFPTAEPYCHRDGLIYPAGEDTCDVCRDDLLVRCPKCGVGRAATMAACGNCGLVIDLKARVRTAATVAGPPPGGAAIA